MLSHKKQTHRQAPGWVCDSNTIRLKVPLFCFTVLRASLLASGLLHSHNMTIGYYVCDLNRKQGHGEQTVLASYEEIFHGPTNFHLQLIDQTLAIRIYKDVLQGKLGIVYITLLPTFPKKISHSLLEKRKIPISRQEQILPQYPFKELITTKKFSINIFMLESLLFVGEMVSYILSY